LEGRLDDFQVVFLSLVLTELQCLSRAFDRIKTLPVSLDRFERLVRVLGGLSLMDYVEVILFLLEPDVKLFQNF
jgi:hypothetical protein